MNAFVKLFLWSIVIISVLTALFGLGSAGVGIYLWTQNQFWLGLNAFSWGLVLSILSIGSTMYWYQELKEPAHNE